MLVPGEGLAFHGVGVAGGGELHGDFAGGSGGASGGGFGDGDGIGAVHVRGRIVEGRVLQVGGEAVRAGPCEGHAGGRGCGCQRDVASQARGVCVGLGGDGASDSLNVGRVAAGASELVLRGDGVVAGTEPLEGCSALVGPAVEGVGVFAACGCGDGDGAVGLEAGGVVGDGEHGHVRCRVDADGELGRVGTAVLVSDRNGVGSVAIHIDGL